MADDRHYVPGDFYRISDRSGFKIRASASKKEWDGLILEPRFWEPRQPQDLVRGVPDLQWVPEPRPRQTNQFTILATYVTAPSARLTYTITVASTAGFSVNDNVSIMLDTGDSFVASIAAIGAGTLTLGTPLPQSVGTSFGDPIENQVVFLSHSPPLVTGLLNDGGVLVLSGTNAYPTSTSGLPAGALYSNGGVVSVVAGGTVTPGAPALIFGYVTAAQLLTDGGNVLPTSAPTAGSKQLWNSGGEVWVA